MNTVCPVCGGPAKRETDTIDTFVCSSWYYYRFTSPHETEVPFSKEAVDYWAPVDLYIGGVEHAVMHLLYARFITKVLYDEGLVPVDEPFENLLTQGMVVLGGSKMSKSKGNVVPADYIVSRYGADVARVFEMFAAPPERDLEWSDRGVEGAQRFLRRVYRQVIGEGIHGEKGNDAEDEEAEKTGDVSTEGLLKIMHRSIKKVTEDLDRLALNTAVSQLMEFSNYLGKYLRLDEKHRDPEALAQARENLVKILNPFAPHLAHELWERLGKPGLVEEAGWPEFDPRFLEDESVTIVIQINGKVRDRMVIPAGSADEEVIEKALASERVTSLLGSGAQARDKVSKAVVVKDKLVNIVTKR